MKNIIFFTILFSLNCFSQSAIQLISNNKSLSKGGVYINLYKNSNTHVTRRVSNEFGAISLNMHEFDSTTIYHFNFRNSSFNPIWQELDLKNKDTLKVDLSYDQYYTLSSKDLYSGKYGYISFLNYYPRQPRRLSEIPKKIADSATMYLKKRVGQLFYDDFKLIDGQIVDLEELNSMYNYWNSSKTSYYLFFSYRNIGAGIKMYVSKIELDKNGNILKDIEFPAIAENSIQEKLVSFNKIKEIVIESGFYKDVRVVENGYNISFKTEIELSYLEDENILIWMFSNTYRVGNYLSSFEEEKRIYNAHNGEFIETKKHKLIIED